MEKKSLFNSIINAAKGLSKNLPVIMGVILLIGVFKSFVSSEKLASFFTQSNLQDTIIGALTGSLFGGNAINSYIIGGELMNKGVSLFAITAFLAAWVTVGIIQIPAEISFLGTRFTITKNILNFFFCIFIAAALVPIMGVI